MSRLVLLHQAPRMRDPDKGRFFDARDMFAWYLFRPRPRPMNYEPMWLAGRSSPDGDRAKSRLLQRMAWRNGCRVGRFRRSQPVGLFELLTAAACRQARKSLPPEDRGVARTWDLDVHRGPTVRSNANGWRRITVQTNGRSRHFWVLRRVAVDRGSLGCGGGATTVQVIVNGPWSPARMACRAKLSQVATISWSPCDTAPGS